MLHLGGVAETVAEGKKLSEKLIASGKALDKFRQMVELQGGDPRAIDDPAETAAGSTHDDSFEPARPDISRLCNASRLARHV